VSTVHLVAASYKSATFFGGYIAAYQLYLAKQQQHKLVQRALPEPQHLFSASFANGSRKRDSTPPGQWWVIHSSQAATCWLNCWHDTLHQVWQKTEDPSALHMHSLTIVQVQTCIWYSFNQQKESMQCPDCHAYYSHHCSWCLVHNAGSNLGWDISYTDFAHPASQSASVGE